MKKDLAVSGSYAKDCISLSGYHYVQVGPRRLVEMLA